MVHPVPTVAAPVRRTHSARFEVHAQPCPHALAKIVGTVARAGLMPAQLHARRSCGGLWLAIEAEVEADAAEQLAERLRASVEVGAVVLVHRPVTPERPHAAVTRLHRAAEPAVRALALAG